MILAAYDALVAQSFVDPLDDLTRVKQPLVENSIIHGLQLFTSDRAGLITITGYQEDSLICLRIADNGSGMDEETVGRLNSQIFSEERSSFGIQSIKKRLKLVTSRISEGTVITIRISQQPEPPL